ncbi:unnamed protein product [Heligmosomoides polygyrus]|uniref:Reverse transcriptase domain-containing protein n=1 Tax=Heligmosomoides polygyrus TaxID=6339 RepID=A0A3P7YVI2_HELPZ|nr:unnamed protein product [Heligmosomoides polygyrus]
MKEKDAAVVARIRLPTVTNVEETWKRATDSILQAARSELGMTKPGRRKIEKQTWLWTDDVKEKVKEKKRLYHAFLSDKTADNWRLLKLCTAYKIHQPQPERFDLDRAIALRTYSRLQFASGCAYSIDRVMPKSTLYLVAIIPMNPLQPDGIEEAMSSARWHFGRKILSEELNEVNVE